MLDFNELKEPRVEIELLDDEAEALLKSPRCQVCHHLGVFHYLEVNSDDDTFLICKFCKVACNAG
jgi:hypothetical protein